MAKKRTIQRRQFDREFKDQAVRMLLDGHSAQSVAENLGLSHTSLLYRWKAEVLGQEGKAAVTLDARVRQLEEDLRRVERERDIPKKALAILSRSG